MKAPLALFACLVFVGGAQAQTSPPPATDPVPASPAVPPDASQNVGEPLPPNAPKQPYELAAWCYGAMDQYLYIYTQIIPQLRAIDKEFGSSVKDEAEPYQSDMAAAHVELAKLSGAVEAAEKASLKVIAPQGARAVQQGRAIWGPAETHTRRELARAWLSWALPDRCASNAVELTSTSNLLGEALKYNGPSATQSAPTPINLPPDKGDAAPVDAPTATAPTGPQS